METVYDSTVSVSGGETRVLELLGDHQYEVTVSKGEGTISFWTRPICSAAHTTVIVDESGELHSDVEDCE